MTDINDFPRLVWRLRKAQKNAKRFPSRQNDEVVLRLEREVDQYLEQFAVEKKKVQQMTFDVTGQKVN